MKPAFIIFALSALAAAATGCKKDKDDSYYNGTWNLREQSYSSADTTYTQTWAAGEFTYAFTDNGNVHIVNTGLMDIHDTWERYGQQQDSIRFGSGQSWGIQDKAANRFKAKFYPTANAFWMLTLEK